MKRLVSMCAVLMVACAPRTSAPVSTSETKLAAAGEECDVPATNRCVDFGACSLEADLRGASGDTLAMYERERKENNTTYTAFPFPHFHAENLNHEAVSSAAMDGSVIYVLLAAHCKHSFDSVSAMNAAVDQLGARGRVIGVVVNSAVDDVSAWVPQVNPKFDVWVHPSTDIGDRVGSHLVPSWFFVSDGELERKLVGYQSTENVARAVSSLMDD